MNTSRTRSRILTSGRLIQLRLFFFFFPQMKNTKLKAWPKTALGSDCRPRPDNTLRLALFPVPVSSLAGYGSENIPAHSSVRRPSELGSTHMCSLTPTLTKNSQGIKTEAEFDVD